MNIEKFIERAKVQFAKYHRINLARENINKLSKNFDEKAFAAKILKNSQNRET